MRSSDAALPPVNLRLLHWFSLYTRWYLQRNFHALRLLRICDIRTLDGWPLLVCLNHPAWWDPLLGLHVSQCFFARRTHYAAMSAQGLEKYGFFRKIGFVGVGSGPAATAAFLRFSAAVLEQPDRALWITPEAEFADVRSELNFAGGVGHIAARAGRFAMLPMALEYAFWTERYPEAFVALGAPVFVADGSGRSAAQWIAIFENALAETQQQLAVKVMARDPRAFESLLAGRVGIGGVYDIWRSSKARVTGKQFEPGHGRF